MGRDDLSHLTAVCAKQHPCCWDERIQWQKVGGVAPDRRVLQPQSSCCLPSELFHFFLLLLKDAHPFVFLPVQHMVSVLGISGQKYCGAFRTAVHITPGDTSEGLES